ncbi:hypothetical protein Tco_1041783 [Tanacetum coccineum]|uniref:Uncharacterized protein n=1 Tax=Tanacetum coccineum TaxID=301880 RepID=A0ABQ5GH55_9ASTR
MLTRGRFDVEKDCERIRVFIEERGWVISEVGLWSVLAGNAVMAFINDSLPELETFSFDIEEKNSGSTTTHFDYSLPIYENFSFHDDHTEEKNSGSTTTHADISLPKYDSFHFDLFDTSLQLADKSDFVFEKSDDKLAHIISPPEYNCFYFDIEPDPGELTRVVMEDIFEEPIVHLPNVLTTLPTLYLDLDFTLSTDFSGSDLVVSFPSGNRNKTFDPEEKSPHLLSHRGFKAFKNIHNFLNESPMMIYGGDIPIWDVQYLHFDPP